MRRFVRIVLAATLSLVVLVAIGAGVLAWLATQPSTLAWLIAKGASLAGGTVVVEGLTGSLVDPVAARRLVYEDADFRVEVANLDMRTSSLYQAWRARELHVVRLAASSLVITSKSTSSEPARLPASLAVPIGVVVDAIDVGDLVYRDGPLSVRVRELQGTYRYDLGAARHSAKVTSLATDYGRVTGAAALGANAPFDIEGELAVRQPGTDLPYEVDLSAGGTLERIGLGIAARVEYGSARGSLVVQPFSAPLIDRIVVTTEAFDPRRVNKSFPSAKLDVEIVGGLGADDRFRGKVRATNATAGPIDRDRIPATSVTADIDANAEGAQLTNLVVRTKSSEVRGRASFTRSSVNVEARTDGLDVSEIHSRVKSTRLAGNATGEISAERQSVRGTLRQRDLALDVDATHAKDRVEVKAFELRAGAGLVQGTGSLMLTGAQPFEVVASLVGFDPSALGRFPVASLSGGVEARGTLQTPRRVDGRFNLERGTYQGYVVEGAGEVAAEGDRVSRLDASLAVAGNRVRAQGAFGGPDDVITWSVDAPALEKLGFDASGRLAGEGTFKGTFERPDLTFALTGESLRYATVASASAAAVRGTYSAGRVDVAANARGLAAGGLKDVALEGTIVGTLADHRLGVQARSGDIRIDTALAGAVEGNERWRGKIERLESSGRVPARLVAPVALEASRDRVRLDPAEIEVVEGRLRIARAEWTPETIATEGTASGILVSSVLALANMPSRAVADLRLGASWRVIAGSRLEADVRVARESGDLRISEEAARTSDPAARAVGLSRMELVIHADRDFVDARLDVGGKLIGTIRGAGRVPVRRQGNEWTLPRDGAISGEAVFEGGELGSLRPFLPDAVRVRGALDGVVRVAGTVGQPRMDGVLRVAQASFRVPDQGIRLSDGRAELRFDENTVRIVDARFAGERGFVRAEGELGFASASPRGRVQFTLEGLDAVNDPMFSVTASGVVTARIEGRNVSVDGKLQADQGRIRLPDFDTPTISDDVVVLGREKAAAATQTNGPAALPTVDLALALGERFYVKGRGVDARITGDLRLRITPAGAILLTGSVSTENGTVMVYGQPLKIEKGTLTFSGPIDNPALNITAVRANITERVGVTITGFVQEPRATLFSDTAMKNNERLAWLVFGRPPESLSAADFAILGSVATTTALGGGNAPPIGTRIAGIFGLDEVAVRTTQGMESSVVALGKRVSDKLYVSFEQSLGGLGYALKLRYELTRNWSVQTQAGIDNTVDLLFTKRFD